MTHPLSIDGGRENASASNLGRPEVVSKDRLEQCPIIAVIVVLCHVFWLHGERFQGRGCAITEPVSSATVGAWHTVADHTVVARRIRKPLPGTGDSAPEGSG